MKFIVLLSIVIAVASASHSGSEIRRFLSKNKDLGTTPATGSEIRQRLIEDNKFSNPRIVGGQEARSGQFPYQVGLSLITSNGDGFWCGGSVISRNYILTAAHCTIGIKTAAVVLGSRNRNQNQIDSTGKIEWVFSSDNLIIHEKYNDNTLINDISVIRLEKSIAYTAFIRPIALPARSSSSRNYDGHQVVVSGWGKTGDNEGLATNLRYINVPIINLDRCKAVYIAGAVQPTNICIDTTGPHSSCQGDSGGPLVSIREKIQLGLTSFGGSSCEAGTPAAFTRIDKFLPWISANTDLNV